MAKNWSAIGNSPQESAAGNIPSGKGGPMSIGPAKGNPDYLDDAQSECPIDLTLYMDINIPSGESLQMTPQDSSIAKNKMKK